MKRPLILLFVCFLLLGFSQDKEGFNPTGTYNLGNPDKTDAYYGEIQVKKLESDRVAMTFYINKGAPSYHSGSFVDTLDYKKKQCVFTTPDFDSTCAITFKFNKKGVNVNHESESYQSSCGFGSGVIAQGFFEKTTSETPVLTHPLTAMPIE